MNMLLEYQWEIFIVAEVLSFASLLMFGIIRYFLGKQRLSLLFIAAFLAFLVFEAVLGLVIYKQTGEFSTFQLVITIFVLYACTFGIVDFLRLDRWMRQKIGKLRNVELLTPEDYAIIARNRDPKHVARKYRNSAAIHLLLFLIGQSILWSIGTQSWEMFISYLTDWSWIEAESAAFTPYANDTMFGIGMLWGIIFIVDFIYSMSYTLFPSKKT